MMSNKQIASEIVGINAVKSQADVYRIPVGARLTVRWALNDNVAGRTYLRNQGTSAEKTKVQP